MLWREKGPPGGRPAGPKAEREKGHLWGNLAGRHWATAAGPPGLFQGCSELPLPAHHWPAEPPGKWPGQQRDATGQDFPAQLTGCAKAALAPAGPTCPKACCTRVGCPTKRTLSIFSSNFLPHMSDLVARIVARMTSENLREQKRASETHLRRPHAAPEAG